MAPAALLPRRSETDRRGALSSGDVPKQLKIKKVAKLKTLDTKPGACAQARGFLCAESHCGPPAGVFTAYKSFLLKDKVLVKRLLKVRAGGRSKAKCSERRLCLSRQGVQRRRPSEVQSAILRRHFSELTHSFIGPLVRPPPKRRMACRLANAPRLRRATPPFVQERYMASLMPPRSSVTPWKVTDAERAAPTR